MRETIYGREDTSRGTRQRGQIRSRQRRPPKGQQKQENPAPGRTGEGRPRTCERDEVESARRLHERGWAVVSPTRTRTAPARRDGGVRVGRHRTALHAS